MKVSSSQLRGHKARCHGRAMAWRFKPGLSSNSLQSALESLLRMEQLGTEVVMAAKPVSTGKQTVGLDVEWFGRGGWSYCLGDKGQRCCEVDGEEEWGEKQSSCRGWMMYSKKEQIIWTDLSSLVFLLGRVCCGSGHQNNECLINIEYLVGLSSDVVMPASTYAGVWFICSCCRMGTKMNTNLIIPF